MKKILINDTPSDIHLNSALEQESHYLTITEMSVLRFQQEVQSRGVKSFNVWLYLEKEFEKEYMKNYSYRKPPKASTISQWFDDDSRNGAKMGTDDLMLICHFISDPSGLVAYNEQAMQFFEPTKEMILENLKSIGNRIISLQKGQGALAAEYLKDISNDGVIDQKEGLRLITIIDKLLSDGKQLEEKITKDMVPVSQKPIKTNFKSKRGR